jgi:transposase
MTHLKARARPRERLSFFSSAHARGRSDHFGESRKDFHGVQADRSYRVSLYPPCGGADCPRPSLAQGEPCSGFAEAVPERTPTARGGLEDLCSPVLVQSRRTYCERARAVVSLAMEPPLFVRPLTAEERQQLGAGLQSRDAFTLRRCQILLASAQGQRPAQIAAALGCASQTVRNTLHAFEQRGPACVTRGSSRPHSAHRLLDRPRAERLRDLLHQSPRAFGYPQSHWTLPLAAEVAYQQGLSERVLSQETVRQAIQRLGLGWKRAKQWITSPDPAYERKKKPGRGC